MARKVKRKAQGVRRAANSRSRASKARAAQRQGKGAVDTALSALPISQRQLQGGFLALILAGAAALAWWVASAAGVPALLHQQMASTAGAAGFQMRTIDLTGVERMNRLKIYEEVMEHRGTPMPLLDLAAIRADLTQMPWVAEARVSRQLPDKLVIDIEERTPHAVLVKPDRLVLIDRDGIELDPIGEDAAEGMLRISGAGAATQIDSLDRIIAAAPALQPQIASAHRIGERRWNIVFKTGQILALPQGEEEAAAAFIDFAKLDGLYRLLGGKATVIDLRVPDRYVLREPGRADRFAGNAGSVE
ncbi:cell division protein FtsQ/DivIB [Alteriqipengyuania lutimaris]|uniref:Cell division protein FtsQ n=1 Tax=Alteriqipengyuania lutimaris TaxID=1538146 RepID=A0A395LSR2_9SPHN|nr:FtsQ-type POTRA domain-containing protein [Alteriqipengyuania lutimaris]MBB3033385.1 cell division protein FtsQ [Alteriqipengyuania lutimaris]RDS77590.1 cell division protein FtsQ [Alteriqipengyuania lutimaris]